MKTKQQVPPNSKEGTKRKKQEPNSQQTSSDGSLEQDTKKMLKKK